MIEVPALPQMAQVLSPTNTIDTDQQRQDRCDTYANSSLLGKLQLENRTQAALSGMPRATVPKNASWS